MSSKNSNKLNIPEAKAAMNKFKMEAASEVGVNLKQGYNGDLTSREAGSVGGQMVKKMIESFRHARSAREYFPFPRGGDKRAGDLPPLVLILRNLFAKIPYCIFC